MSLTVIVGPTAAGKSDLALALAERIGAEIVIGDSMQGYRGMDIGTAKPTEADRRRVPHHLVDAWDPTHELSVVEFRDAARAAIADVGERGRPCLLVGGSWLYVQAIVDDIDFPGTDPRVRERIEAELHEVGAEQLYERLRELDPDAAAVIAPANARRIVRALEVVELTGSFTARLPEPVPFVDARWIGIDIERPLLDARIEARVEAMWSAGLVDEVRLLRAAGLGRTAANALGYRQVLDFLAGRCTEDEARAATVLGTRRFARRQQRRFAQEERVTWIGPGEVDAAAALVTST